MKKINVKVPHPVKLRVSELPGSALTNHTYTGFGKELCVSVSDSSEEFEEKTEGAEGTESNE